MKIFHGNLKKMHVNIKKTHVFFFDILKFYMFHTFSNTIISSAGIFVINLLFYGKNLRMSKICCTFAPAFEKESVSESLEHGGKMAEWSIASVLKTEVLKGTGGSNPSLSARLLSHESVQACLRERLR